MIDKGFYEMRNVWNVKRDDNLNFILPLDVNLYQSEYVKKKRILIVIHMHYLDSIEYYFQWINEIPQEIDIIFTISNKDLEKKIEENINRKKGCYRIFYKKNRGRDISALLVASRKEILNYEYVCFIHDKKARNEKIKKDVASWIKLLWENTIGSSKYIENIIYTFECNTELGMLVPPIHISPNFRHVFSNAWEKNFDNTAKIAEDLTLSCDLDKEKSPIAIGTVFWAKVDALRKLLEVDWKYEDFMEEPLPADGTFSHAIERILPYVAQDAGYSTGWIMTTETAGERMEYLTEVLTEAFAFMKEEHGIADILDLHSYQNYKKMLGIISERHKKIYIYGAGVWGAKCVNLINSLNIKVEAILVTKKTENYRDIKGIPIVELSTVQLDNNAGVIVAVNYEWRDEIISQIHSQFESFENIYMLYE